MIAATLLGFIAKASLAALALAMFMTLWRVVRGPTLADRVLALDMLSAIAIGFMAVFSIISGHSLYVDIAIALGLVGFLATIAFARFLLTRRQAPPPAPAPSRPRATRRRIRR
jgi:multicomponent Na+:H+ antiporter subunit F